MSNGKGGATLAACVFAASLISANEGNAQSAGTTGSPPGQTTSRAGAPAGPGLSPMPLARPDVFENAASRARGAKPDGTRGVSSTMPGQKSNDERGTGVEPQAFGISTAPYTTSRVAVTALGPSGSAALTPVSSYPFRATGKLWSRWGSSWFVCTAALVKKGVLLTAAHCVFHYGQKAAGWADEVLFYPANTSSAGGPYGFYSKRQSRVPTTYYNGNDTCTQAGVVCNNDIATVVLNTSGGKYAGNVVGWYAYGWNGYSYKATPFLGNTTTVQITQLGYPAAFDSGYQMQRTDAVGWYVASGNLKNTQIGSAQTGGSSGGPWLANFGTIPSVNTSKASRGSETVQAVIGVTSYGATQIGYNRQGASYFGQNAEFPNAKYGSRGAGNVGKIMQDTCNAQPGYC